MKTVKEVSAITGISVRALHYYDEIGLLKPTDCTEAGYRLYDDRALEDLQQILFFREFDMPLKEIKAIMNNPELGRDQILQGQKRMLELKKARLERLFSTIDDILKGDNRMDFEVFNKDEIESLYQATVSHMPDTVKKAAEEEFGGMEGFHRHYVEHAAGEKMQQIYQKLVEWYGDKESVRNAAVNPPDSQIAQAYLSRMDRIMKKLSERRGRDAASFEVKEVIGEYGFIVKQLYQIKDEKPLMLQLASYYKNPGTTHDSTDSRYGDGTAAFFAEAVEAFYR